MAIATLQLFSCVHMMLIFVLFVAARSLLCRIFFPFLLSFPFCLLRWLCILMAQIEGKGALLSSQQPHPARKTDTRERAHKQTSPVKQRRLNWGRRMCVCARDVCDVRRHVLFSLSFPSELPPPFLLSVMALVAIFFFVFAVDLVPLSLSLF